MKKYVVILLANSLLLSSSAIVRAMDPLTEEASSQKNLSIPSFKKASEAYEKGDVKTAISLFTQLRQAGSSVAIEYLKAMGQDPLLGGFESEELLKRSKMHHQASDLYKKYKTLSKEKDLQDLGILILNKNFHALYLMKKLCAENNQVFPLLKKNKKFNRIKTVNDFSKDFKFSWDCLDIDNVLEFYPAAELPNRCKALNGFKDKYLKNPECVGQIALDLAGQYPDQPFWAYLAIENGKKEGRGLLIPALAPTIKPSVLDNTFENKFDTCCYYLDLEKKYGTGNKNSDLALHMLQGSKSYSERIKNPSIHLKQLKTVADLGYLPAQINYTKIQNEEKNFPEVLKYSKMAADQGDLHAQHNYGLMRYKGRGGTKDRKEALTYYEMSADQGFSEAQLFTAQMYDKGKWVKRDAAKACHYYKLAADQGIVTAQYNYAQFRRMGDGVAKDTDTAIIYYKKAADQGMVEAQRNYSNRVLTRYKEKGTADDLEEALKYSQLAMNQGASDARTVYGCACYYKKNFEEALKHWKIAADQGDLHAQHNYAFILYNKEFGYNDLKTALKYAQMAVNQDFIKAVVLLDAIIKELSSSASMNEPSQFQDRQDTDSKEEKALKVASSPNQEAEASEDEQITLNLSASFEEEDVIPSLEKPTAFEGFQSPSPATSSSSTEEHKIQEENNKLNREYQQEIVELRAKKHAKKVEQSTPFTITLTKAAYKKALESPVVNPQATKKKIETDPETFEFLQTIFGQGKKRIHTYTDMQARKYLANLGCGVENKTNGTDLSVTTEEGWIIKGDFHNSHGHDGKHMYEAQKLRIKRFCDLAKINPETVQVK